MKAHKILTAPASWIAVGLLATLAPQSAPAQEQDRQQRHEHSARERGLEIAVEADRRDAGFGDYKAQLTMVLRNKHGQQSERRMRVRILEQADDGDKALIIFDNPGDVKGTAFLSFTHQRGADDQWLYLPALKRVKRIASSRADGTVELSIADTGVGIPPEDLPHIFDEFRQVERQGGEQTEGTGLGLAIAKKTVDLLGGVLTATSEVGVGTTFTLRIGD